MEVLTVESNGHAREADPDEWLSAQLAAEMLGSNVQALGLHVYRGTLHPRVVDGVKTYSRREVEHFRDHVRRKPTPIKPEREPDLLLVGEAAKFLGVTAHWVGTLVERGQLATANGDERPRLFRRADVEAFAAARSTSTALVPVAPARPVAILPPADPLAQLLGEYREAAAKLAVAKHDHEEAARRERELAEEVNTWDCEVRLLREKLDKGLDEVVAGG